MKSKLKSFMSGSVILLCMLIGNVAGAAQLNLVWDNVNDVRQQGYIIQRVSISCASVVANTSWLEAGRVQKDVTTYSDTTPTEGNTYCYRVAAYNPDVSGQWSNLAGKRIPFGAPSAVQNLIVQ